MFLTTQETNMPYVSMFFGIISECFTKNIIHLIFMLNIKVRGEYLISMEQVENSKEAYYEVGSFT